MALKELLIALPRECLSPRPPVKPLLPAPPDATIELPKTAVVRRPSIVLVVAPEFRVEDRLLLPDVIVSMVAAPCGSSLEGPP
jgi:hypothetical protein